MCVTLSACACFFAAFEWANVISLLCLYIVKVQFLSKSKYSVSNKYRPKFAGRRAQKPHPTTIFAWWSSQLTSFSVWKHPFLFESNLRNVHLKWRYIKRWMIHERGPEREYSSMSLMTSDNFLFGLIRPPPERTHVMTTNLSLTIKLLSFPRILDVLVPNRSFLRLLEFLQETWRVFTGKKTSLSFETSCCRTRWTRSLIYSWFTVNCASIRSVFLAALFAFWILSATRLEVRFATHSK